MNITDRISETMLPPFCNRCGYPTAGGYSSIGEAGTEILYYDLCSACIVDFKLFIATPPEQPDTSSDSLAGTREDSDESTPTA